MGKFRNMQFSGRALQIIGENGALLVTGSEHPNVMTMSWCMTGVIWQKSIFMAPVRKSRYSHKLMEETKEFTVFVPFEDMKTQTALCGSKSGRDTDKIALCNFTMLPSRSVSVPHIQGKGIIYECRVVFKAEMDPSLFTSEIAAFYSGKDEGNTHTFYFGEILDVYEV